MPNPFYYGGHVSPEQFVGRKAELQRIFAALEVAHSGQIQSISVVGPRRIGKSSLLFYVANRFATRLQNPANYRIAYVELSDANCRTQDGLLRTILSKLNADRLNGRKSALAEFQDRIVEMKNGSANPIVCLDEFEELTDHPDQFTLDLYDSWRYLINQHAIAFVTSSKAALIDLQKLGFSSPFFNVFTHLPLGELTDDEARELIARGADSDRPLTPTEQSEAMLLAGNHPYRLQLACSLAYEAKANGRAVDWAEIRREYIQQLQQVGLEVRFGHALNVAGQKVRKAATDASDSALKAFFKALIDKTFGPGPN